MSDLAEKLEQPHTAGGLLARQKLKHLKVRWGVVEPEDWRKVELIQVRAMDEIEYWSRHSGVGEDAEFQLIEKRKA